MREVGIRELDRRASGVIATVRNGERTIVTRHGIPVAVLLSIADLVEIVGPRSRQPRPAPTPATIREEVRDVVAAVIGDEVEQRLRKRQIDRMLHARWY